MSTKQFIISEDEIKQLEEIRKEIHYISGTSCVIDSRYVSATSRLWAIVHKKREEVGEIKEVVDL